MEVWKAENGQSWADPPKFPLIQTTSKFPLSYLGRRHNQTEKLKFDRLDFTDMLEYETFSY